MNNDDISLTIVPEPSPWPGRLQAIFEVVLISGLLSGWLASFIMAAIFGRERLRLTATDAGFMVSHILLESVITFFLLALLLRTHHENLSILGLRAARWKTNVILGVLLAPLLLLLGGVIGMVFEIFLPQFVLKKNPLTALIQSPRQLLLFITAAIIAGGIKEELQRAFVLRRFRYHLGGSGVGLVVWSLVFGAGHYLQGWQGVFVATVYGFIFGIFYLARKNLVGPITAHAVYDTLALLLYWTVSGHAS